MPLSQEEEDEDEPPPKSIRKGSARRLKFDTKTTHVLFAEFKGLGVRITHVTRRKRTIRRTKPKSNKKKMLDQKFCLGAKKIFTPKIPLLQLSGLQLFQIIFFFFQPHPPFREGLTPEYSQ